MPSIPPQINSPPLYVKAIDDNLRVGSFVRIIIDKNTTSIARIHSRIGQTGLKFVVFPPLFPKNPTTTPPLPKIPEHNFPRILISTGCRNIELYQSKLLVQKKVDGASIILHPAFVFNYSEFKKPKNAWTHGLSNVYIARFRVTLQNLEDPSSREKLVQLDDHDLHLCFPNEHLLRRISDGAICPPRCFHQSAFVGLFLIWKAIFKLLKKCSGQAEEREVAGETIGLIPTETWTYVVHLCRRHGIKTHNSMATASYLDVDPSFTRKKVRMEYPSSLIRFKTPEELKFLRGLLGFGSTYGLTERKPTLKDGEEGLPIKHDHCITVVNGQADDDEDGPIKKHCRAQRVDFCWSDFSFRVVVSYEQFQFSVGNDGKLRSPPSQRSSCQGPQG